jgi:competence ComEA-like helix-hairpin-helix protein
MMKEREPNKSHGGGLLLLFSLLMIHALCNVFSSGADSGGFSDGEGYHSRTSEMTAFQKMTLGMHVSINLESLEGLTAVPGIGPGLAGLIVKERDKRGGFKSLDEITSIRGIGPGLYKRVRSYLVL